MGWKFGLKYKESLRILLFIGPADQGSRGGTTVCRIPNPVCFTQSAIQGVAARPKEPDGNRGLVSLISIINRHLEPWALGACIFGIGFAMGEGVRKSGVVILLLRFLSQQILMRSHGLIAAISLETNSD